MENKKRLADRLEQITVLAVGIYLLLFPIILASVATDAFTIPKQALLAAVALLGLVAIGVKGILLGAVKLRRTPYDLPIVLFGIAAFFSAVFAVNRFDAFISFVPLLLIVVLFFVITNSVKRSQDILFLSGSLMVGAAAVSVVTLLSYLKIYPLPFEFAKFQTFTPFGALFDQAIYLGVVLSLALVFAWPALKKRTVDKRSGIYVVGAFAVGIGLVVTLLAAFTLQKPTLLPYQVGFQTALSAISQDTGRTLQGFLVGSGYGTYATDFTRFKPATINLNEALWNLTFLRSSSYMLELIATTGLLGILSFLFLAYRMLRTKPVFIPFILLLLFALLLPFAFTSIFIFFVMLALFSAREGLTEHGKHKFFDVELKLVTLRRGVFALADPNLREESEYGNLMPWGFLIATIAIALLLAVPIARFVTSDYLFQKSLVAAAANNGQETYRLQTQAINTFPQRDGYHRIFSQLNLNLANNLALTITPESSPSAETQQTILQLIQQSINSGRNATQISPLNSVNWQNLSSVYRSLIGFGQNADQFAVATSQQALVLDPNNPQLYIGYGGVFYQLGQWDNAITQFQIATNLKPDFANAYFNLGHALEEKGELQAALDQYRRVRNLVGNDETQLAIINPDIERVEAAIGAAGTQASGGPAGENKPPIEVNQPPAQLPEQKPPVEIPEPEVSLSPSPTPSKTPTPTP